jgi:hypothetical protein
MEVKKSYPINVKHHYIEELHELRQMSSVHVSAATLTLPKFTAHDWLQGKHLDYEGKKITCLKNHRGTTPGNNCVPYGRRVSRRVKVCPSLSHA